jgi:hypothetical protein
MNMQLPSLFAGMVPSDLHAANHPHAARVSERLFRADPLPNFGPGDFQCFAFSPDCKGYSKPAVGEAA